MKFEEQAGASSLQDHITGTGERVRPVFVILNEVKNLAHPTDKIRL